MATSKTTAEPSGDSKNPADEVGAQQVQDSFDEAAEKGYFGPTIDPTPRENYSLQTPPDAEVPEVQGREALAKEVNARHIEARVAARKS